ncbi:C40 family peptidase [Rhodoferax sp.]|uniref:C40 family peptidase n=1 Tax=Rhodoferax sp. TaxID=50421 RepID=UPI002622A5B3|nr:C40 family peptidase [Rhodoferax sp.]MDD2926965.1 C40 family peptidase [Rhodoferax sp.]
MNILHRSWMADGCVWLLVVLVLGGCSTPPSTPEQRVASVLTTPKRLDRVSAFSDDQAHDVTMYAVGLVGTPYRYGGNTPDSGFDCSGLIRHVYQSRVGVAPPRTVAKLQHWGEPIAGEQVRSGDLVLFAQHDEATHAGIYVGDGRFVHAPSSGGEVRLDRLSARYWAAQRVTFRRP